MRERFERELKVLHDEILRMGLLVERALSGAMAAVKSNDVDSAEAIIEADAEIDATEEDVERLCAMIIAREQPMAGDLRDVLTALKLVSELERMGDHARSLAKRTGRIGSSELGMALPYLETMMDRILVMMKDALTAFADRDSKSALDVAAMDSEVDRVHDELYALVLDGLKDRGEFDPEDLVSLLFLNRFMERLGDRVTNMCEWIYYARTGERLEMNRSGRL